MNQSGQVVGRSVTTAGASHAFLWEGGSMYELPASGTAIRDISVDLNDGATRIVVGGEETVGVGLLWTVSGSGSSFQASNPVVLPGFSGIGSFAFAVNDAGVVVGYGYGAGRNQPAKWTMGAGGWAINALPLPPSSLGGIAFDINTAGTIVGRTAGTGCTQALVWSPAVSLLPGLTATSCSEATAVNDAGQIAGTSSVRGGARHAALWRPLQGGGYGVMDLGAVGNLPNVQAINEPGSSGQASLEIVGGSYFRSGALHATLWTVK